MPRFSLSGGTYFNIWATYFWSKKQMTFVAQRVTQTTTCYTLSIIDSQYARDRLVPRTRKNRLGMLPLERKHSSDVLQILSSNKDCNVIVTRLFKLMIICSITMSHNNLIPRAFFSTGSTRAENVFREPNCSESHLLTQFGIDNLSSRWLSWKHWNLCVHKAKNHVNYHCNNSFTVPVKQTSDRCASWQCWVETLLTPKTEGRTHRQSVNRNIKNSLLTGNVI